MLANKQTLIINLGIFNNGDMHESLRASETKNAEPTCLKTVKSYKKAAIVPRLLKPHTRPCQGRWRALTLQKSLDIDKTKHT